MKGFFAAGAATSRKPLPLIAQCEECRLYKGCSTPKMQPVGKFKKKILIIGEAPGESEDRIGKPFVGKTGQLLQDTLRKYGVELFQDCLVINSCWCRPPKNELPKKAVEYCRPNVINTIKEYQPEKIILVGANAVKSVIGWLWKEDPGGIGRWCGWKIPCQRLNAWVTAIWHPSFVLREEDDKKGQTPIRLLWERQLSEALLLEGRPWNEVPNYAKEVQVILDAAEAGLAIRKITDLAEPVAFDYENSPLKPDSDSAFIHCCSVSNGRTTLAFPWHGDAITAMRELLLSDVPKLGWNVKHESRFTKKLLGFWPRNWKWDGMLAAHTLDNRSSITSLKFQAFVTLGQESYDGAIKPHFNSASSNVHNRIKELDLRSILLYCGTDSVLTWHIAMKQMKQMGVRL